MIGRYSITTSPKAKAMESKMQWVMMKTYKRRPDFDYRGMKDKLKKSYSHVLKVEDIWIDCRTKDIRKLDYCRLSLDQIINLHLADILEDMEDKDSILDLAYESNNIIETPLPPIQWLKNGNDFYQGKIPAHSC